MTPFFLADFASRAMSAIDPERAHHLTVKALKTGLGPKANIADPRLACDVAGISFPNPLGLAAGFDKNAEAPAAMLDMGFGFVEVGAVTPRPQPGNDRPRVFRLTEDQAVINRYGFNNEGLDKIAARLAARRRNGIVGVNLGANKDAEDRTQDFVDGLTALAPLVDFLTVNISSPNTPGLRALQDKDALLNLLSRIDEARSSLPERRPVFLKIAPDITDEDKADISAAVRAHSIDGVIVSNTTITRPESLSSSDAAQVGGLSGAPLFEMSTRLLHEFYGVLGKDIPLIGVGGVSSALQAYEKILSGASLVQLYTALVFQGPGLPSKILKTLPDMAASDGFARVADAVGAKS